MLTCAVCGLVENEFTETKICASCKSVGYCSTSHQRADWTNHQKSCSLIAIEIRRVKVNGENLDDGKDKRKKEFKIVAVAPRDFQQGEIILDERPLFNMPFPHCCGPSSVPPKPSGFLSEVIAAMRGGETMAIPDLQCLTCGVVGPQKKCSSCSAPICSQKCKKAAIHAENECLVFSSSREFHPLAFGKHSGGEANCPVKQVILIRIEAVKKTRPEVWEAAKSLVDPQLEFNDDYEMLQWLMKNKGFLHLDESVEDAKHEGMNGFARITCLYKIGSQIDHSCAPNCTVALGHFPDFKMRVRSAVPIKKGEILSISRLVKHPTGFEGTFFRRETLRRLYSYTCQCSLCSDVTENGTFQSAIKHDSVTCRLSQVNLSQDKKQKQTNEARREEKMGGELPGYFLPASPNVGANWVCSGCGAEKSEDEMVKFMREYKNVVEAMVHLPTVELVQQDTNFGEANLHRRNLQIMLYDAIKCVHPNHFLIQHGLRLLAKFFLTDQVENFTFFEATKQMLKIAGKISPGLSQNRADIELYLCGYLGGLSLSNPLPNCSNRRVDVILWMVKECQEYHRKVMLFYQNYPPERGGKVCKVVEHLKEMMEGVQTIEENIKLRFNIQYKYFLTLRSRTRENPEF